MLKNNDTKSGLLFLIISVFFIYHTLSKYPVGTASDMGPGYFPLMFAAILAVLGLWILVKSWMVRDEDTDDTDSAKDIKNLLLVIAGIVLFGIFLTTAGFLVAAVVLLGLMTLVLPKQTLRRLLLFSSVLIAFSYLVFSQALGLYFPFWPKWIF